MKTKVVKSLILLAVPASSADAVAANSTLSYVVGGIVALLILGYLVYTLLKPERF